MDSQKAKKIKGLRFRDPETGDLIIIDADTNDFYKVISKTKSAKSKKSKKVPDAKDEPAGEPENSGASKKDKSDSSKKSEGLSWLDWGG